MSISPDHIIQKPNLRPTPIIPKLDWCVALTICNCDRLRNRIYGAHPTQTEKNHTRRGGIRWRFGGRATPNLDHEPSVSGSVPASRELNRSQFVAFRYRYGVPLATTESFTRPRSPRPCVVVGDRITRTGIKKCVCEMKWFGVGVSFSHLNSRRERLSHVPIWFCLSGGLLTVKRLQDCVAHKVAVTFLCL